MEENKDNEDIKDNNKEGGKENEEKNEENIEKNDEIKKEKIEEVKEETNEVKNNENNDEKKEEKENIEIKEEIKDIKPNEEIKDVKPDEEIKEDKNENIKEDKQEPINEENKNEEKIENENKIEKDTETEKKKEEKEEVKNENKETPSEDAGDTQKKEETDKEKIENNNDNATQSNTEATNDDSQLKVTMTIVEKDKSHKKYELPQDFIEDKNRCNILTQKLVNKTKKNANMKLEEFFTKKRHYLIMTDGGKPVYSRYGDEVENNSIFATISAMITKFTIFNNTDSYKEEINIISNNKNKIVFMKKGQLIFIALSKKINDSVSLLHSQLEFIYNQLMSILTVRFYEKLEDNPSKCLTAMGGTENLFEQIIQYSSNSFISLFNSYQILNFININENRDKINKILEDNKGNSLYCILMTPYEIISFAHSNQINVTSSDLILIQNLIFCTEMLRTQESYVPICLPGISDQGFLQLYSHFSEENIGIIFVTENMDPMCFMEFQQKYNDIYEKIKNGYSEKIVECMRKNNNIKGKYTLFKRMKEMKKELNDETLVNLLLNKIKKHKGILLEEDNNIKKIDNINSSVNRGSPARKRELTKIKTTTGTLNLNTIDKLSGGVSILEKVKYGVILNRKYNQYIMINFGMDYRNYNKKEKYLIHKYSQIYDVYSNSKDKDKDKDEFFYIEKTEKFYNVIHVNEFLMVICSFNFFSDIEDIHKRTKEILKYFKKFENKYFIIYK